MPGARLKQHLKAKHLNRMRWITHQYSRRFGGGDTGPARNYFIDDRYVAQEEGRYFDAIEEDESWQVEVYQLARRIFDDQACRSVADIGCGSAAKLLQWFKAEKTWGVDVSPTYDWLVENYPDREWRKAGTAADFTADLVIMSDVIEHVNDPIELLDYARSLDPRYLVISTPDRAQLWDKQEALGPPSNRAHIREWTFKEFGAFMRDQFDVFDHHVSNFSQATQVVVARPKGAQ
ncbi:MAG: class I SAM-dependent methyltransferase [Alphaproteobacteria bacterium]